LKRMIHVPTVFILIIWLNTAHGQNGLGNRHRPEIAFKIEADKNIYLSEESITVTYSISNIGTEAVYVNPEIRSLNGWDAGVQISVYNTDNDEMAGGIAEHLPIPDYKREDVLKIVSEKWILMVPGAFYGMHTSYFSGCKLAPGRYRVAATYFSNILEEISTSQVASLDKLNFPILTGHLKSNEIWIEVKPGDDGKGLATCPRAKSHEAK
jgi:hypothetical protein